ncbi:MAG: radical SAM family heme chaperone HemW [Pseudomonadota bacterium]
MPQALSLYIHWPFCLSKCPYCDFNSHVREHIDHQAWLAGYLKELRFYAGTLPHQTIKSIFFGGGTPSLMDPKIVEIILNEVTQLWSLPKDLEITLEANPQTVEIGKFKDFHAAGINRVSLGIQSLDDTELKFLGRLHDATQAMKAITVARQVFMRYSLDFIYALPGQSPKKWQASLAQIAPLLQGHISAYQLTIEPGTAFHTLHQRGEWTLPDEEISAQLYEMTRDVLGQHGFQAYEISNYARTGGKSQHNLTYWRYQDYLGIGPGAHGRLTKQGQKYATYNHKAPEVWLEKVGQSGFATKKTEVLSSTEKAKEMLMMGLRLEEGVQLERFRKETGHHLEQFCVPESLASLKQEGLIELDTQVLRATQQGRQRLNAVLPYMLP